MDGAVPTCQHVFSLAIFPLIENVLATILAKTMPKLTIPENAFS
jgi:hypothetical protein